MTTTARFLNLASFVSRKSNWFLALAAIPKQSDPDRAVVVEPESDSGSGSDDDSNDLTTLTRRFFRLGWWSSSLLSTLAVESEESESSLEVSWKIILMMTCVRSRDTIEQSVLLGGRSR